MIEEGALNPNSTLLKTKHTMTVRDPNDEGIGEFLEDTMAQLLDSMNDEDRGTLARFFVNAYIRCKKDITSMNNIDIETDDTL